MQKENETISGGQIKILATIMNHKAKKWKSLKSALFYDIASEASLLPYALLLISKWLARIKV